MRIKFGYIVWFGGLFLAAYTIVVFHGTPDLSLLDTKSPVQHRSLIDSNANFLNVDKQTYTDSEKQSFNVVQETIDRDESDKQEIIQEAYKQSVITSREKPSLVNQTEVRHVAFLKVHKTASSTAQNVFLRFGDSRKLNFALPHSKGESGWPNVISYNHSVTDENVLPPPTGENFDILCCHVLYNRKQFEKILPPDTVYIGIVREPVSRFQSAVKYFSPRFILKIPGPNPLSTYVLNPTNFDHDDPRDSQTNNRMATEFGFPLALFPGKSQSGNIEGINKYLEKLDKEFKFVIISERFDESMVLMRRLLKWKLMDVMYIDQNVGQLKPNPKKILLEKDIVHVRKFLFLDMALYDWAIARFRKQIDDEGEDFIKELEFFRSTRERLQDFCKSRRKSIIVEETPWNEEFSIVKTDCVDFYKHEKDLILRQRIRMYGVKVN